MTVVSTRASFDTRAHTFTTRAVETKMVLMRAIGTIAPSYKVAGHACTGWGGRSVRTVVCRARARLLAANGEAEREKDPDDHFAAPH